MSILIYLLTPIVAYIIWKIFFFPSKNGLQMGMNYYPLVGSAPDLYLYRDHFLERTLSTIKRVGKTYFNYLRMFLLFVIINCALTFFLLFLTYSNSWYCSLHQWSRRYSTHYEWYWYLSYPTNEKNISWWNLWKWDLSWEWRILENAKKLYLFNSYFE
jgi:hypothetical protein